MEHATQWITPSNPKESIGVTDRELSINYHFHQGVGHGQDAKRSL